MHGVIKFNLGGYDKFFIFNSYCTIPFHNLLKRYRFTKNAELSLFIIEKKMFWKWKLQITYSKDIRWASQYRLKVQYKISAHPEGPGHGPLIAV